MNPNEWLQEQFETQMERISSLYPEITESDEFEQAQEDGAMSWEEAMSEPLYYNVDLEIGGELEIKINHDKGPSFQGQKVFH